MPVSRYNDLAENPKNVAIKKSKIYTKLQNRLP